MLACLIAQVRASVQPACMCMYVRERGGVYVEGAAASSRRVLKEGVLVVVGGWLLFGLV